MIHFDLPKQQSSIIKVIGVGGGGSNAVNYMAAQGIEGVDFIICNTDAQALAASKVSNKIQLGPTLTQGLGAGANPQIGRQATVESLDEIKRILEVNTKMVFITAGMGGGTGTGGAPIVAKMCRDLGILTVGIVTMPFSYEGKKRLAQAEEGIEQMKEYVDTLLVISNDKLRHQFGNLTMREAFSTADNVLATAAKCITDVINSTGQMNVDFADVCTVMRDGGVALLGSARAEGENRAQVAIEQALSSPLLNDNDIRGAKWILININAAEGPSEFTMDEVEIVQQYLHDHAGPDRDVIMGLGYDNSLGSQIGITLIATGFENKKTPAVTPMVKPIVAEQKVEKIILNLESPEPALPTTIEAPRKVEATAVEPAEDATAPVLIDLNRTVIQQPAPEESMEPVAPRLEQGTLLFSLNTVPSATQSRVSGGDSSQPEKTNTDQNRAFDNPVHKEASATSTSGGFLSRPSKIYAEDQNSSESEDPAPVKESHQGTVEEVDPASDMQLVIKENPAADEPMAPTTHILLASVEEPALQDEAEEQKRKAAERLNKLRNLSFNLNAADPNNEFEQVPAFIRRNLMDHQSGRTAAEQFYSSYTVKADEHNNYIGSLSTLNTFLDGKKPD